jgi:thiamine biosynthesis lipoprotein
MKETRMQMGMPVTIELPHTDDTKVCEAVFAFFDTVDARFSTYKDDSEISRLNRGDISSAGMSDELKEIFSIAEEAKQLTNGYFDIQKPDGSIDPSGVVKGWALLHGAEMLDAYGVADYCIDIAGDIATKGHNAAGDEWSVGIRSPFIRDEIVKVIYPHGKGVATSGSYIRGAHVYDPLHPEHALETIVSITVVGPDILQADLMATAAFAMGAYGITFIESLDGFEAYSIDRDGIATMTSGFLAYV